MISELKVKANRLDIPYQALIKQAIAKKLLPVNKNLSFQKIYQFK